MLSNIGWHVVHKNHVWLNYFLSYGSLNIENNSFCDRLVSFTAVLSTMRGSAENENCKSGLLIF